MNLRAMLRLAQGLRHGIARGEFVPSAGRWPGAAAPLGSEETRLPPLPGDRSGVGAFVLSQHRVGVPGLGAPLRLLQLSDVHLRAPSPWLDHLVGLLAGFQPDLLLLTGDLVAQGWTEAAVDRFLAALPPARLGRFAVLGNWEHWTGVQVGPWRQRLARHGVELLVDEVRDLGELVLGGTDDLLAGTPDPVELRRRMSPGRPGLVLSHSPAIFPALAGPGVDLVLSGHAHGGQVRLPGLGALWVPQGTGRFVAGWYEARGSRLFVHRGVGWSIAPWRRSCTPELAEILLVPTRRPLPPDAGPSPGEGGAPSGGRSTAWARGREAGRPGPLSDR